MVQRKIKKINLLGENQLRNNYQVAFKSHFKQLKVGSKYAYSLKAIATLETIQLWLGMKFGFNIVGILLN